MGVSGLAAEVAAEEEEERGARYHMAGSGRGPASVNVP